MCILSIVNLMPLGSACVIAILVCIVKACKYLRLLCTNFRFSVVQLSNVGLRVNDKCVLVPHARRLRWQSLQKKTC